MKARLVLDACVLTSIVNSDDIFHQPCYQFFRERHDEDAVSWVIPGLVMFEYQATQSRRYPESNPGKKVFRYAPLFVDKCELYELTKEFLWKVDELGLYDLFRNLKGADLVYACIAWVEGIPLVTHDKQFTQYGREIQLMNPCEL